MTSMSTTGLHVANLPRPSWLVFLKMKSLNVHFFHIITKCKINISYCPSEKRLEKKKKEVAVRGGIRDAKKIRNEIPIGREITQDQDSVANTYSARGAISQSEQWFLIAL